MNTASIIAPGHRNELEEVRKIAAQLREKYAPELRAAPWWKRLLLRLKIQREAVRTYRRRIYAT